MLFHYADSVEIPVSVSFERGDATVVPGRFQRAVQFRNYIALDNQWQPAATNVRGVSVWTCVKTKFVHQWPKQRIY